MSKNRVADILGIKYPVIMAAMSWCSDAKLVAAVSNAGGLGILGPNAGQTEATFDPQLTRERMREQIRQTRALTDKPFGVNYILPVTDMVETQIFADAIHQVLIEEGVKIVMAVTLEMKEKDIRMLKDAGFTVICRDLNTTPDSIKRAEAGGADMYIATGMDAGGHTTDLKIGTMSILPQITSVAKIPVIAAGGIVTGLQAKAAYAMGAEGVYVGTRFLVAEESPVDLKCKKAIIDAKSEDLVEFKSQSGYIRSLPTKNAKECVEAAAKGATSAEIGKLYQGGFRVAMRLGDIDNGIITVSSAVGSINSIDSAQDIVEEMTVGITN